MATTANGTPYVESSDLVANYPAVSLALANKIDSFAKIRQIVRATATTLQTTTSTSYVDANLNVTITPQRSTSAILLIANYLHEAQGTNSYVDVAITDNANNVISGDAKLGVTGATFPNVTATVFAYSTPATTSATTYKLRHKVGGAGMTSALRFQVYTGQLYAIEVSA